MYARVICYVRMYVMYVRVYVTPFICVALCMHVTLSKYAGYAMYVCYVICECYGRMYVRYVSALCCVVLCGVCT